MDITEELLEDPLLDQDAFKLLQTMLGNGGRDNYRKHAKLEALENGYDCVVYGHTHVMDLAILNRKVIYVNDGRVADDENYNDCIDEVEIIMDSKMLSITQQKRHMKTDQLEMLTNVKKTSQGCHQINIDILLDNVRETMHLPSKNITSILPTYTEAIVVTNPETFVGQTGPIGQIGQFSQLGQLGQVGQFGPTGFYAGQASTSQLLPVSLTLSIQHSEPTQTTMILSKPISTKPIPTKPLPTKPLPSKPNKSKPTRKTSIPPQQGEPQPQPQPPIEPLPQVKIIPEETLSCVLTESGTITPTIEMSPSTELSHDDNTSTISDDFSNSTTN